MYSPKRNLRLFRGPAWMYSWRQPSAGPSTRGWEIRVDDTGQTGILANAIGAIGSDRGPYITRDGGATWSQNTTGISFGSGILGTFGACVARSSPNIMYCANGQSSTNIGYIYKSTDYGSTWTELTSAGQRNWRNILCNPTGTIIVAAAGSQNTSSGIYRSTDGGSTWTLTAARGDTFWGPMCMSDDGETIVVGTTNGGRIQISRNGGTTFTVLNTPIIHPNSSAWTGFSCSVDGQVIFASSVNTTTLCALSTNYGSNWTTGINPSGRANNMGYQRTACSADGKRLLVTEGQPAVGGYIWMSEDMGTSWSSLVINNSNNWEGIAMTVDGKTIIAGTSAVSRPWFGSGNV